MTLMTWTADKFGTSVSSSDDEHKRLFDLTNDLHSSIGGDRTEVDQKLDALIDYVVVHFQNEEGLMKTHGYPDYEAHKEVHDDLVNTCVDLQKKFKAGEAEVTEETTAFVKDWLYNHIPVIDTKYGPFLNEKGIS
jgi:hemerythrin